MQDFLNNLAQALVSGAGSWWLGGIFLLFSTAFFIFMLASSGMILLALFSHRKQVLEQRKIEQFKVYADFIIKSPQVDEATKFILKSAWEALEGGDNPYHLEVMQQRTIVEAGGGLSDAVASEYTDSNSTAASEASPVTTGAAEKDKPK